MMMHRWFLMLTRLIIVIILLQCLPLKMLALDSISREFDVDDSPILLDSVETSTTEVSGLLNSLNVVVLILCMHAY